MADDKIDFFDGIRSHFEELDVKKAKASKTKSIRSATAEEKVSLGYNAKDRLVVKTEGDNIIGIEKVKIL